MSVRETIYLRISKRGVQGMTKTLPTLHRGEIPVRLIVSVEDSAFAEPVIERHVTVADWRQGIDLADVDFREAIITEKEAEIIRAARLKKMKEILQDQGYQVTDPDPEPDYSLKG